MLTAHLPSGYCLGKGLGVTSTLSWGAALSGAVFPDIDMLLFHLVDNGAIHHHRYWIHIPFFWIIVAAAFIPLLWKTRFRIPALLFFAAVFLHLFLDSVGGGIMWLVPFDTQLYELITIPATRSHWILSFILHWTFLLELAIWLTAAALMLRRRSRADLRLHLPDETP